VVCQFPRPRGHVRYSPLPGRILDEPPGVRIVEPVPVETPSVDAAQDLDGRLVEEYGRFIGKRA
jgi:hypothetical protein